MTEPVEGENPKIMSLSFPGGAMAGIHPLVVAARIEELTGKPFSDLFQNMEGGSAATFLICGMNLRKSNDPASPDYNVPHYTMKEGLKLFIEETPGVFPDIPARLPRMLTGQYINMEDRMAASRTDGADGFMDKLRNKFNAATEGMQISDMALSLMPFSAPAFLWNKAGEFTRDQWAKDYMYDPDKLAALYKKVLGEDTKLSDVRGTVHLPVYNMTAQEVQYFTVEKKDLLNPASGNASVSHGDPKLWEVAMAATANNLAYKPYIMEGQVYFDGAMFQKPTTHLDLAKREGGPEVVLVELALAPPGKKAIPDIMDDSKAFNGLVDVMHKDMLEATGGDLKLTSEIYGSAIDGFTEGGLTHVRNYVRHTTERNAEREAFEQKDGNVIRIAPPALKENEDPKSVPGFLDAFTATPSNIVKYLNYSARTLEDQDTQIRHLATELLANQVRLGRMTLEEFKVARTRIETADFKNSEIPAYLESLKTNAEKPQSGPDDVAPEKTGRSSVPSARTGTFG